MANRSKRTPKRDKAILDMLGQGQSILAACQAAGIVRSTYYEWRDEDQGFADRADEAIENGTDIVEDVLLRVAVFQGNVPALIAILKARRRHKYDPPREHQITGEIKLQHVAEAIAARHGVPVADVVALANEAARDAWERSKA